MMQNTIDQQLPNDLEHFLIQYHLENIGDKPISDFADIEFPVVDRRKEHQALSKLVARLLRLSRMLRKHTSDLDTLDERDLVRPVVDPALTSWWDGVGYPALLRLAFLDCRERLGRLARLAEEARECRAIDRLVTRRADEALSDLGRMNALVSWLYQEIVNVADLTKQVPGIPVEQLPRPSWELFLELQQQQDRLGDAMMDFGWRGEEPEFLNAYLAKSDALHQSVGNLSEYSGILDFRDPFDEMSGRATAVKYSWVRKTLEMGIENLSVNQERLADVFPSEAQVQSSINEAFRLTDKNNALWDFIGTEFFRPEDWKANREALKPLLLRQPQYISPVLRGYLSELAHAFVLGHWASVQALSRALLEQSIKLNCKRLAIDLNYTDSTKKKSLEVLTNEFAEYFPEIKDRMHTVRDYGNKILHTDPLKSESEQAQAARRLWMREDAVRSLESLYAVLEALPKLAR